MTRCSRATRTSSCNRRWWTNGRSATTVSTYTFTLRDGLLFHDGTPVESKDVTASLKRWAVRDTMGQALMKVTASIEPVDAKTFRLVLTEPYGLVIDSLGKSVSNVPFIMQEEAAQTDPFEQVDSFIGSGPFRFVEEEWVPGNKVVYEKFEDYVPRGEPPSALAGGKVAKVDRVEWFYIPDPATAMGALQNNEVDFYEAPPVDLVPALEANPDVVVGVQNPYGLVVMLRPNHLYPPFDKAEARRALSYMVDQEEYMTAMVGNPEYFQTCASMLMCGTPYAVTTGGGERMVKGDMAKAKELMDQVYQDETVVVMHPTDHPSGPTALVTAAKLRELGVNVELQAMDWSTLTSRRTSKNPPTEGGWSLFITRTGVSAATLGRASRRGGERRERLVRLARQRDDREAPARLRHGIRPREAARDHGGSARGADGVSALCRGRPVHDALGMAEQRQGAARGARAGVLERLRRVTG